MSVNIPSKARISIRSNCSANIISDRRSINIVGGNLVYDTNFNAITSYRVHVFSSSGILTVASNATVECLVVAGGGGGGSRRVSALGNPGGTILQSGSGGGAGGLYYGNVILNIGTYNIIIGSGGSGGSWPGTPESTSAGSPGIPSKITLFPLGASLVESIGGGGGGGGNQSGSPGGSGGGGGSTNSPIFPANATIVSQLGGNGIIGQGNPGGAGSILDVRTQIGGGGGGAGATAGPPNPTIGGTGFNLPISFATYSTGGSGNTGTGGSINTGNGGGGAPTTGNSGAGGSGIIIIRYRIS